MSDAERVLDWLMGRDGKKARCKHQWKMKGSRVVELSTITAGGRKVPKGKRTEVLYVCEGTCGEAITKTLEGAWSDEQLQGTKP